MTAAGRDKVAFRRWVRENHPDVGGDPERFAEATRAFDEGRWAEFLGSPALGVERDVPPVYVSRRPRGLRRLVSKVIRTSRRRTPRVK
jgi:hypothetical protein